MAIEKPSIINFGNIYFNPKFFLEFAIGVFAALSPFIYQTYNNKNTDRWWKRLIFVFIITIISGIGIFTAGNISEHHNTVQKIVLIGLLLGEYMTFHGLSPPGPESLTLYLFFYFNSLVSCH